MVSVCRGASRTTLLTRRWAVKVPSFRCGGPRTGIGSRLRSFSWGIAANHQELDWNGMPGFCPVRWSLLGLVQIYPRCEPVVHEPTDTEYRAITDMDFPSDYKPDNVGYLDGRLVWIDYGS